MIKGANTLHLIAMFDLNSKEVLMVRDDLDRINQTIVEMGASVAYAKLGKRNILSHYYCKANHISNISTNLFSIFNGGNLNFASTKSSA